MKIISVEFNTQGYARIEHSDGSVRVLPPLYARKMLCMGKEGNYRYDKKVPYNDDWYKEF